MRKGSFARALICLFAMVNIFSSCSEDQPKYHQGGPYYYKGWANYYLPYRPVDEITRSEADELENTGYSYCIAYFTEEGLIKYFETRSGGQKVFKIVYMYENGVLRTEVAIDVNNETAVTLYDERGKRISP